MKNASSPPERSSRSRRKSPSSAKIRPFVAAGLITSRRSLVVGQDQDTSVQATNDERPTTVFMKRIRYSKYVPDPAGEMSMEDLLSALSDYLLQSGFQNYMFYYDSSNGEHTLEELRRAIEQALLESDLLNDELREQLQQMQGEGSLEEL